MDLYGNVTDDWTKFFFSALEQNVEVLLTPFTMGSKDILALAWVVVKVTIIGHEVVVSPGTANLFTMTCELCCVSEERKRDQESLTVGRTFFYNKSFLTP